MDNNGLPAIEGSGEELDRRNLLKQAGLGTLALITIAGTTGLATQVLAQEVQQVSTEPHQFEYMPSKLGIDYRALTNNHSPLSELLSQGEAEWMEKAKSKYGEKTARFWEKSISKKVSTGAISDSIIEKLREFTPDMLTKFAAGLDPQDPKYGYLWSIGSLYVSEKFAGKA